MDKRVFGKLDVIVKSAPKEQNFWAWASVVKEGGELIVDAHGDIIEPQELTKAAHGYVINSRDSMVMHVAKADVELFETIVLNETTIPIIAKRIGGDPDTGFCGWLTGWHVNDLELFEKIESGEYTGLSIGGSAQRVAV